MANRLVGALSPYLQQHADNPVDWREWSPEAFAEARRRDVPVLLSVGYAACHWCHVMAHESFEDPRIGELINANFVAIKVDREERPDIDAVYMRATQLMTGSGGWPMTVFLDHEGRPFHAGTYYPPADRHGLPSFERLLLTIANAWRTDRARIAEVADAVAGALQRADAVRAEPARPGLAERAVAQLQGSFDPVHAGFGGAPKFPPSMVLEFLLRHHARTGSAPALRMAEATCEAMARGGIYDQLGGGFARYSVDEAWIVPHYEKMLYDNALLARVYLHLWRANGSALARRVAIETCEFLLRELRTPEGGFAASLDADSDPAFPGWEREGAYYVWNAEQLGEHAAPLGVADGPAPLRLREEPTGWPEIRARLRALRDQRPRPARDDKVVAGWNGLAIAALAEVGFLLERPDFVAAAGRAADLVLSVHGRLRRVSRDGVAGTAPGALEDYAGMAEGLLALYQCTGDPRWLRAAGELLQAARAFADGAGGFYEMPDTGLLTRAKDPSDNATPSGWTLVTGALLSYAALTGDDDARRAAQESLACLAGHPLAQHPRFFGWGLAVMEARAAGPLEVAVIGEPGSAMHRAALAGTSPGLVVAIGPPGSDYPALLAHRDQPAAYVCRDFACELPTGDPAALRRRLGALPSVEKAHPTG